MEHPIDGMIRWIGNEACGINIEIQKGVSLSEEELQDLYRRSKSHDLAHLVGSALFRHGLLPAGSEWTARFKKQMMLAMFRYEQSQASLEELCAALEEAEIPFLPLKGSVLRQFYPAPWMRTSCDIDILVHETDLERASNWLAEKLSYRVEQTGSHDLSLFSPNGLHVELHYHLMEDGIAQRSREVLEQVWDAAELKQGARYHYELRDPMFYFYHIAHMAKHFEIGGCGVRSFLDLWVMEHRVPHDTEARDRLLEEGGLLTFANVCRAVSEAWFSEKEADALAQQVQAYILVGGTYGNAENQVAMQQSKQGGRFAYAWSKIFLKYDVIKFHYPILIKHKWLLPFMQIRRWGKLLFCGGVKRSVRVLRLNQSISKTDADQTAEFIRKVGL